MNNVKLIIGRFLAIFVTLAGLMKIYQTIVETFRPGYIHTFHENSANVHFGLFMLAAGLTAIWSLGRR